MTHFGARPRFEMFADGSIVVRAGTQTNCGGIAEARVFIVEHGGDGLECVVARGQATPAMRGAISATSVPSEYREAMFAGARDAYARRAVTFGICVELLEALVHPVDANERRFREAGASAVDGWLDWHRGRERG